MKPPINCIICNKKLRCWDDGNTVHHACTGINYDHSMFIDTQLVYDSSIKSYREEIYYLYIDCILIPNAIFDFTHKSLMIGHDELPFFEPNLSNYRKLANKLETLQLFI